MDTQFQEQLITADPSYQKWTQWLFLKLKEHGLAYKKMGEVNWCVSCETVLAREQVKDQTCERCGSAVVLKELDQWYFRITAYRDRLVANLDKIDYPAKTIKAQRNWLANLHDWCVSRQRSWGCPIPIEGETDTLDTFVDSSFYTVRYCDPSNDSELCNPQMYQPVDLYVGGNEHACMHLIYARFIHMFLFDIGVVSQEEPFNRVVHQGMILNDGEKMSKSKGNVVSPDTYDPDVLRFYLMFLGPYQDGGSWSDQNIKGVLRFRERFAKWLKAEGDDYVDVPALTKTVFDYTYAFKFNKVVSSFMIFLNNNKDKKINSETRDAIMRLISVYMPNFAAYYGEHE